MRAEWAAHGVPAFASADYSASLDAVCERLGVNQEHNDPSMREQKLRDACVALGWHIDAMPRNVTGACDQGRDCGYCGYGCRRGAKQSTAKTWLRDAQRGRRAHRRRRRGRARDGRGRRRARRDRDDRQRPPPDGPLARRRRRLRRAAHAGAAEALRPDEPEHRQKPACPSGTAVWGVYDDEIRPWEGTMQALYSDEHRNLDHGYGVKYETAAGHPSLGVGFMPWRGARSHYKLMEALSHTCVFGILLRDRDGGEVRIDRAGQPVVRYRLSDYDVRHLRVGIEGAARMHEAAGAQQVFSSHSDWVAYEPGAGGWDRVGAAASASCATPTHAATRPASASSARST